MKGSRGAFEFRTLELLVPQLLHLSKQASRRALDCIAVRKHWNHHPARISARLTTPQAPRKRWGWWCSGLEDPLDIHVLKRLDVHKVVFLGRKFFSGKASDLWKKPTCAVSHTDSEINNWGQHNLDRCWWFFVGFFLNLISQNHLQNLRQKSTERRRRRRSRPRLMWNIIYIERFCKIKKQWEVTNIALEQLTWTHWTVTQQRPESPTITTHSMRLMQGTITTHSMRLIQGT